MDPANGYSVRLWLVRILAAPSWATLVIWPALLYYAKITHNRLDNVSFFGGLGWTLLWLVSLVTATLSILAVLAVLLSRSAPSKVKLEAAILGFGGCFISFLVLKLFH